MKKLLFIVFAAALVFASCSSSNSSGSSAKPSDVATVAPVSASSVTSSGVAAPPANLADTVTAISGLASYSGSGTDAVYADVVNSLSAISSTLGSSNKVAAASTIGKVLSFLESKGGSKDLSSDITTQLKAIETDIGNFPKTKSLNETVSLSGDSLGTYFKLTTATCSFSASLVTTDSAVLDTENMSNFKSASGQGTLSLVIDPVSLASTSIIKDFKLRINAGGTASLGAKTVNNEVKPADLVFDYGESAVLALSFNNAGTGGKFVITTSAKNAATIADPSTLETESASLEALAPTVSISIAVYNDAGTQTFTKTWTDLTTFETDLSTAASTK